MRSFLITLLCLLGLSTTASAQLGVDAKVNVGSALTGGLNVAADVPLGFNKSLSLGFAYAGNPFGLDISTGDSESIKFRNVRFIPEFRYYFSPREGADRFFVGAYGKLGRLSVTEDDGERVDATRSVLGILAGHKWVSPSGFVFELNAGFGRSIVFGGGDGETEFERGYGVISRYDPRLGILLGYRFGK